MPVYIYKVKDKSGKTISGRIEAANSKLLREKLDEKNYFILDFFEKRSHKGASLYNIYPWSRKVKINDLAVFSWQLYTMLNAGMTLISSLNIIVNQTRNEDLKAVIAEVANRIGEGVPFSAALKEHPLFFSRLYVQMVNAGEVGGVLDEMLRRLAVFLEDQAEIRSQIRSALVYPVLLLTVSLSVAVFLLVYVLPKVIVVFEDMGTGIPLPTRILVSIGSLIQKYFFVGLSGAVVFFIAFKRYMSTESGRLWFDGLKLKIPVIGDLATKSVVSRFTQTLSILVSGGIPILVSLDVVTEVVGNSVVARALKAVTASVKEGKPIAKPLKDSNIFPEMVVNMIAVGEETGALDKMLAKIAEFYTKEVSEAIKTFTKLIEPILIVFMTIVIGFIAISIFLPMTDIMSRIQS